jgi:hypothetical protein
LASQARRTSAENAVAQGPARPAARTRKTQIRGQKREIEKWRTRISSVWVGQTMETTVGGGNLRGEKSRLLDRLGSKPFASLAAV